MPIGNGSVGSDVGRESRPYARPARRVLRLRILTAVIVAPLVIGAIFLLPLIPFAAVFLVFAGIGAFEWAALAGLRRTGAKSVYAIGYALLCWILLNTPAAWNAVLAVVVAFWLYAACVVVVFPRSAAWLTELTLLPLGYVAVIGAWLALLVLQVAGGPWLILWLLCVVWAADIGAYFAGRSVGRRKLAVEVSPGKTWEGAIGGAVASMLTGVVLGVTLPTLAALAGALQWATAALGVAIVSVFGDLFESALKRARGVKDSGTIFPGHGGMLDRIDSLLAALPCFAVAVAQYS